MTEIASESKNTDKVLTCGIVMPISNHADYPIGHWDDVKKILFEAIEEGTDFQPFLVSDGKAIEVIHDRIVTNLFHNEIVVCDVSSLNPNVMFELGLRLAFDKPTIIIKDERHDYIFDTSPIEHIVYPSSLRFFQIIEFKQKLIAKIIGTYDKSINESSYSPFLRNFGKTIVPSKINEQEIPENKYIIQSLIEIKNELRSQRVGNLIIEQAKDPSLNDKDYLLFKNDFINYMKLNDMPAARLTVQRDAEDFIVQFLKTRDFNTTSDTNHRLLWDVLSGNL